MTTAAVNVPLDNEGFLVNRDDWSEEVAVELARADDFEMTGQVMEFILKARAMYDEDGVVPPIRIFAKKQKVTTKEALRHLQEGPHEADLQVGRSAETHRLRMIPSHRSPRRPPPGPRGVSSVALPVNLPASTGRTEAQCKAPPTVRPRRGCSRAGR